MMLTRIRREVRQITAGMLLVTMTGCGQQPVIVRNTAPFPYHGRTLTFAAGTVEARVEEGVRTEPYARLVPDKPISGASIDARYNIDLGRRSTGTRVGGGYWLGARQYPLGSEQTDLGDGYAMLCPPAQLRTPAFNCATLLRSLPFAAIQYNAVPASAKAARSLVAEAETYLTRAESAATRR